MTARRRYALWSVTRAAFRDGQWEAVAGLVVQRQRVLVVQRTGWGKSTASATAGTTSVRTTAGSATCSPSCPPGYRSWRHGGHVLSGHPDAVDGVARGRLVPDRRPRWCLGVDETFLGAEQSGPRGWGALGKMLVVISVELLAPKGYGRTRMSVIPDASAASLRPFLITDVEPGVLSTRVG